MNKGINLTKLKSYKEAVKCFDRALESKPEDIKALRYKGASLTWLGEYEDAISCFNQVLKIDPKDFDSLREKGDSLNRLRKYKESIECYDIALKINPLDIRSLEGKANSLSLLGLYAQSIEIFDQAIKIETQNFRLIQLAGNSLALRGDYRFAIQYYNRALSINSQDIPSLKGKAFCLENLGEFMESIKLFDRVIEIDPNDKEALQSKGNCMHELGFFRAADDLYDLAVQIDEKNKSYETQNKELEKKENYISKIDKTNSIGSLDVSNITAIANSKIKREQIFVVHGHDEEMKQSVARTLEKLDLKPIILHEKPNQGSRTIIEKFIEYAENVSFAVVLLSPDDKGYGRDQDSESAKFRARQNVILELGFFIGKLGRDNVVAISKNESNFELPSDLFGIIYISYGNSTTWQYDLVRELRSSGYNVDANKLES